MQISQLKKEEIASIERAVEYIEKRAKKIRTHIESCKAGGDDPIGDTIISDASVIEHNAEVIQHITYRGIIRLHTQNNA